MKNAVLVFWFAILGIVAAGYGGWWAYQRWQVDPLQNSDFVKLPKPAGQLLAGREPQFTLTERSGDDFDTTSLEGKVWVVTFFFTSCPGPCFRQNQALAKVQKDLADRDVRFLSITCDPAVDTPEKLREYAERLGADAHQWLFLTGRLDTIKGIAREQFLLPLDLQSHSERAVVIDRTGKIRDVFETLDPDDMQRMTRLLIELDDETVAGQS
jgi:protein SCO1/2